MSHLRKAINATERPPMMKVRGCKFEFWAGSIGIDERLRIYDGEAPAADKHETPARSRKALALHMIDLWSRFGDLPSGEQRSSS